jgi:integrase
MPRSTRNIKLETRSARAKLLPRSAPYFLKVAKGLRLGYYRSRVGAGTWIGRRYLGNGEYETASLGIADDTIAADNVAVFDFWRAQDVLRRWGERGRLADRGIVRMGPYTVRTAVEDYLAEVAVEKRASALKAARYIFEASVLPKLGHLVVEELTSDQINRWRNDLAASGKRVRTKKYVDKPVRRLPPASDEERRKRRATSNRVLTMLKAALNRAYRAGRVASDEAWRKVKPFKQTDLAVVHYLSDDEARRLVNACDADFRLLVQAALLTGCRYSELVNLTCADFNCDNDTLMLRRTKTGNVRHVVLTEEGRHLFTQCTAGRAADERIFLRSDAKPWGASHQQRPLAEAASRAKISPAPTFHILRHTHASLLAMRGVPMGVIAAQLGHRDTRMTEKHYAHLAPSYVAETIRVNFPKLGIAETLNVVPLRVAGRAGGHQNPSSLRRRR